ncbi:lytic polysaccharide monooxygenase [Shewanella waksmanii]|uniref:lytic polysaccharide monooxygenase n=1 Tax=Shewanella waksmanii TaxID=213783 RepID=UPI0037350E34
MFLKNIHIMTAVTAVIIGQLVCSSLAQAHGFMQSPKARQQFCVDDGGYWWPDDGSAMPNLACRQAFLKSGTKQFVQNHEFSANVVDYQNQAAVQAAVPNGLLCAGGDNGKSGMDEASAHWQRTELTPGANGEVQVIFSAHTPHNPSYWEFYLSNENFDAATETLTWEKLSLVSEVGNVQAETMNGMKVYKMTINLPTDRSGEATLYTRWQRIDEAGEGFYNCSDVLIVNDSQPPQWQDLGQYVANGTTVTVGDEVWFRVFDANGQETVFEKLAVIEANQSNNLWASELAQQVANITNKVQIGVKQPDGSVVYSDDIALNRVWSNASNSSYRLDVKSGNLAPTVTLLTPTNAQQFIVGDSLTIEAQAADNDGQVVSVNINLADTEIALIEQPPYRATTLLSQPGTFIVTATATDDAGLASSTSVSITVSDGQSTCSVSPWQQNNVYVGGDQVSFQSKLFKAKWWTRGEQPDVNDEWGVWELMGPCQP